MTGICLPIFSFLLTLVWFSGTTTGFFSNGYNLFFNQAAKITPADAYVVVGDELVPNCTLTQFFTKNLNASFMYFGRMSDSGQPAKIPGRLQHVLGPRILQLRIPGMKKTNADTYSCYINETSVGGSATAMPAVPATVQVDFRPDPVTSVTCISDNFESMTCSWCPEVMPSTLTRWTLDWRIGSASAWSTCTIPFNAKGQRRCSCTWLSTGLDSQPLISAGAFKPSSVYELRVTTKSRFLAQPFRAEFAIAATQSIVKPRVVQDLHVTSTNSSSLEVTWLHPIHLHPSWFHLVYQLMYKSGWADEDTVVVQVGNATSVQLTGLWPATDYSLSVRCRPVSGQYWSNNSNIRVRTPDDAPSASPTIPVGSFRTHPCRLEQENCRSVTVFWQPIATKYHNGDLHGYEVSCRGLQDGSLHEVNIDSTTLSATFKGLDADQYYVISVVGYNNFGRSPTATLTLPPSDSMTRLPGNLVAELSQRSHVMTFSWSKPIMAVSNYTLLWCEGVASQTDTCQGQLNSVTIPGHVTTLERAWEVTNVYALSCNSQSGSSGMQREWLCVYDYDGLPGTPVFSFGTDRAARSLTIQWRPLECSLETRGRVLYYTLQVGKTGAADLPEPITLPPGGTTHMVRHLQPATNYTVTLTAVTRAGSGHPTRRYITTLESRPDDPPHELTVTQLPESETKLTWSPSPTPNGVITKYKVIVRDGTKIVKQVLTDGTERIMLLQNLDGYKTYSITVAAVNKVGVSDESRPITFQTPIRAAAKIGVDQIEVEPYTTTEAMVRWTHPSPPNGPITMYVTEYMIRDEGNDIVIDVKNDTVLANMTKTLIRVSCGGQPKLVDVRVRAVTTVTGRRHLAEFSDWKRAIMCKDPGLPVYIWAIPVGIFLIVVIALIIYCVRKWRHMTHKKLDISVPTSKICTNAPDRVSPTWTNQIGTPCTSPASRDGIPGTSSVHNIGMPGTSSEKKVGIPGTSCASQISMQDTSQVARPSSEMTSKDGIPGIEASSGMVPPVPFLHSEKSETSCSSALSSGGAELISGYSALAFSNGSPNSETKLLSSSTEGSTATGSPASGASNLLNSDETEETSLGSVSDDMDPYSQVEKHHHHSEPVGRARQAVIGVNGTESV